MILYLVAIVILLVILAVVISYALAVRGLLRGAIIVADNYAPYGRNHIRIPYNLACKWAMFKGANSPRKVWKSTQGFHLPEESLK